MNTPKFLSKTELLNKFKDKINQFIDIEKVHITKNVEIGNDNVIFPNVYLMGNTKIGNNNKLQMGVVIEDAIIDHDNLIGPYSFIRKDTILKNDIIIGPYCEIKDSILNNKVTISHKSFVGNTIIGENSLIGAGTTIANFDGKKIVDTIIGKNVFIGSNVTLVAPIKIYNNVFISAGSTITEDVNRPAKVFARVKDMTLKEL